MTMIETNSMWEWLHRLGGPGLIALGLADNTPFVSAPPGSMDIVVILLSAHSPEWWVYYAFMATVGEVLGGYLTYRMAEKGGQETLERRVGKPRAEKVYKQFEKRGAATVLSGAILPPPFPFTSVVMVAGVMHYPRKKFLLALIAGRALRFLVVAYLGRIYGQKMIDYFARYYHPMMYVLIALAVAGAIGALVYFLHRRALSHKAGKKSGASKPKTASSLAETPGGDRASGKLNSSAPNVEAAIREQAK